MAMDPKDLKLSVDLAKQMAKEMRAARDGWDEGGDALIKQNKTYMAILKTQKEQVKQGKLQAKNLDKTAKLINNIKKNEKDLEKLGIKRKNISQALKRAQKEGNKDAIKQLKIEKQLVQQAIKQEKTKRAMSKITKGVKSGLMGWLSIGGLITGVFSAIVKIATGFAAKIDKIGKQFGTLASDKGFVKNLTDAEFKVIGIGGSLDDVISATSTLAENFGYSTDEASALSSEVFRMAKAMGTSVDEAGSLLGMFDKMYDLSLEQSESLITSTFNLAKMNKVAPAAVMKDIAKNQQFIAKYGKQHLKSKK